MDFKDKSIQCSDCGNTFTFSAEDQVFFHSRGYTDEPKYCPSSCEARKLERYGNSTYGYSRRQMFPAVYAEYGKDTQVPFEPGGQAGVL